jgi:hypothetical protein
VVTDWLGDQAARLRSYRQWFHLAPELEVEATEGGLRIPWESGRSLHVASLVGGEEERALVRGQMEPELLGWISRNDYELEPCWAASFGVSGVSSHAFARLFSFGETAPEPDTRFNRVQAKAGRLRWEQDGERWEARYDLTDVRVHVCRRRNRRKRGSSAMRGGV